MKGMEFESSMKKNFDWIDRLRHKSEQFGVVGLGQFGRSICETLHRMGYEVMAIDQDEQKVAHALQDRIASSILALDATDPHALKQSGLFQLNTVIISLGQSVQNSVITTLNAKEGGVQFIVAKASSRIHETLLYKIGADWVVFPELEMAQNLALSLTKPNLLEKIELDSQHSLSEIPVPPQVVGQKLLNSKIKSNYQLMVIAIRREGQELKVNPSPQEVLEKGDRLIVIGEKENIKKILS